MSQLNNTCVYILGPVNSERFKVLKRPVEGNGYYLNGLKHEERYFSSGTRLFLLLLLWLHFSALL